jgi:cytochrome c oxidase assembly factor CtaG
MRIARVTFLSSALGAVTAWAHGGDPGTLWSQWNGDPWLLASLALPSLLYAAGVRRLWANAGSGRAVSRRQVGAFAAGVATLIVALVSPLDAASDQLQSAHMIQHMLLMMVAAPLLMIGAPGYVVLWALPRPWRSRALPALRRWRGWRPAMYVLWQPLFLWALFAVTLWVAHLPAIYEAALHDEFLHALQHTAFLVTACLFWGVLLDPIARLRLDRGTGVLYLFGTSLHATLLGVYMALAPRVWYPSYVGRTEGWRLTPLEDQQLAGLIMWMPACMVYAIVAAVVFAWWLETPERGRPAAPMPRPRGALP